MKIKEIDIDIAEESEIIEEIKVKSSIFINLIIDLLIIDFSFLIIYSLLYIICIYEVCVSWSINSLSSS